MLGAFLLFLGNGDLRLRIAGDNGGRFLMNKNLQQSRTSVIKAMINRQTRKLSGQGLTGQIRLLRVRIRPPYLRLRVLVA